ncbi:MAG: M28 family peptidase [Arenicellales bacterium]|nr:M28 family peptidase [Arenicellales bacterium]
MRHQTITRKLCIRLIGAGCLAAILFLSWFVVTQPFVTTGSPGQTFSASAEKLKQHVYVLSQELPPRAHSAAALDITAAYIREQFKLYSGAVHDQTFEVQGETFRNVIAHFGPKTRERLVIGAHYDTAGGLPGADDNASGVAGLIEIARLLQHEAPAGTVELIAYTLEEPPFFRTPHMGSAVHASSLHENGVEVKLMISLEMIGYFDDRPGSQSYPSPILAPFYPDTGNFIAVVGNLGQLGVVRRTKQIMRGASPLPVYSLNGPSSIPGVDFSDHLNYWRYDFPAIMVTDTAFYRNPAYHSIGDTADRLDYFRMAQVVEGVLAVIHDFSKH